jgi:cell division septum initiation protein DivIVA
MARNLKSNWPGHNTGGTPEKPFFDRLVALRRSMEELREDIKEVKTEAKEADVRIGPLELAVKRYLETEKERNARLGKEEEAERILRAITQLAGTPLGLAAVESATA